MTAEDRQAMGERMSHSKGPRLESNPGSRSKDLLHEVHTLPGELPGTPSLTFLAHRYVNVEGNWRGMSRDFFLNVF